jgi:protein-tyrosine-phosphatase
MLNSTLNSSQVSVVCRANEVRSRIIEGFLKSRFPQIEVRSFGTDVDRNGRISSQLTRVMNHWGIEINEDPPVSISSEVDFLHDSSIIISADEEISKKLRRKGISSTNLCDFAIDKHHIPDDPLNFPTDLYFVNAAKVLHCTARLISEIIERQPKPVSIRSHITSEDDSLQFLALDEIVIDARLGRSAGEFNRPGETRYFEEAEILTGSAISTLHSETKFYAPKYEFRQPEKTLLSSNWALFVKGVSSFGSISVITTPLSSHGRQLWDPFLASILAEHVQYR